jgi:hypothetical protein
VSSPVGYRDNGARVLILILAGLLCAVSWRESSIETRLTKLEQKK